MARLQDVIPVNGVAGTGADAGKFKGEIHDCHFEIMASADLNAHVIRHEMIAKAGVKEQSLRHLAGMSKKRTKVLRRRRRAALQCGLTA